MQKVRYTVFTRFLPEDDRQRRNAPFRQLGSFDFTLDMFIDLARSIIKGSQEDTELTWASEVVDEGHKMLRWIETQAASGIDIINLPDWRENSDDYSDYWYSHIIPDWITAEWMDNRVEPPVPSFPLVEAFCHECNQTYEFKELLKDRWRWGVSFAGKGGTEWRCPLQHRLIFSQTWVS